MRPLEDFDALPTVMDIDMEMAVIGDLMDMPTEYLRANKTRFARLVSDLAESHTGGGYFQLTRSNERVFLEFSNWLREVDVEAEIGLSRFDIDDFRVTYDDLLAAYPGLREAPPTQAE